VAARAGLDFRRHRLMLALLEVNFCSSVANQCAAQREFLCVEVFAIVHGSADGFAQNAGAEI